MAAGSLISVTFWKTVLQASQRICIRQFGSRARGIRERVDSVEVVKTERTEVHGSLSPRNLISSFTGLILLEKAFALSTVSCN